MTNPPGFHEGSRARYFSRAIWYLRRPHLYADFFRQVCRVLRRESDPLADREAAEQWCCERAIDVAEGIARITGKPMAQPVRERFKSVFASAEASARRCPFQMGGAGSLDLIYCVAEWLQATRVVETGVGYGWSSLTMLLSLRSRGGSRLISTDRTYVDREHDWCVGCAVPEELRPHWQMLREADREALPKALSQFPSIDLCHYDSDKTASGRRWAYPRLWKALRSGGCFLSDDVSDDLVFRDFCSAVRAEPVVVRVPDPLVGVKYVGALVKRAA